MTPAWKADIDIDTALARRLIWQQFRELAGCSVEPFGTGWDNAAFLIGERIIFRFPRRRVAAMLIERETALLPLLAPFLPLPISSPTFIGAATDEYPWQFAGYPAITGQTACSISLSDDARELLAGPLASFLRALHAVEPAPLIARGLPPDELGRLDHDKRMRAIRERLDTVMAAGVLDAPQYIAWLETHPPEPLADDLRRVLHGDMYARHVLLDAQCRVTGIIDWGDMHFGDPALDLAIAHLMLPAHAHRAFREAYGPIDTRTWHAARYRAVYHAFLEINYAVHENDAALKDAGLTALRLMRTTCIG